MSLGSLGFLRKPFSVNIKDLLIILKREKMLLLFFVLQFSLIMGMKVPNSRPRLKDLGKKASLKPKNRFKSALAKYARQGMGLIFPKLK